MMNAKVYKNKKTGQFTLVIKKKDGNNLNLLNKEEILINGIEREDEKK